MRSLRVLLIAGGSLGCGPESADVDLRDVCGESAPVQVLAFPEDARPYAVSEPMILDDDRLLWQVDSFVPGDVHTPYFPGPRSAWITGRCGESPRRIDDVEEARLDPHLPGAILSSLRDGFQRDVVAIDAEATERRTLLYADVGYPVGSSDHGWFSLDFAEATDEVVGLALRRYPDDPWSGTVEPIELARVRGPIQSTDLGEVLRRVAVRGDTVWVVNVDEELLRISLPDGTATVEQRGVRAFELSDDARWLMWQDTALLDDSTAEHPIGQVFLRDTADGTERPLWHGRLDFSAFAGVEHGALRGPEGWVRLADLSPSPVPRWSYPADAGRWILQRHADENDAWSPPVGISLYDFDDGTETVLYDGPAQLLRRRDDGVEIADAPDFAWQPPTTQEAELLFLPYDGGPMRPLARAVTSTYLRLTDGRIVTPLAVDAQRRGELVLVDPTTLDEARIDDDVFVVYGLREAAPELWGDAVVLYSVADGERSGMWIARLPEAYRAGK